MENTLIYASLALSGLTLALCAWVAWKMKAVLYLLEQPSVRKMSPQLKLKPVKLDELMAERNRQSASPGGRPPQQNGPRPPYQGGRPHDGGRPHGEHRNDQDRRPPDGGRDRFENRDRQDRRPDRGGDRDRFRDRDRNRGDRFQSGDRRPPQNNDGRDAAPTPSASAGAEPVREPVRSESPTPQSHSEGAPLAPRRPLPSTVENETNRPESTAPAASVEAEGGSEGLFNSDDVQHGRRTQLKKKPRFDLSEEEVKTPAEG